MTHFQTTRWSLVLEARSGDPGGLRALEQLCAIYRPPVLAFLLGRGRALAEAEDLTQGFFEQLLRLGGHARAEPLLGRFRVYLLVALKNFLANQASAARAQKRGGGRAPISLDAAAEIGMEPAVAESTLPDQAFERDFARATVQAALTRLQAEANSAGKSALFEALRLFLLEPPGADEYAQLAERLGLRRNTLAVAIHRMRQRLQELVRRQLADTLGAPEEIDQELQHLHDALGRTG